LQRAEVSGPKEHLDESSKNIAQNRIQNNKLYSDNATLSFFSSLSFIPTPKTQGG